MSRTGLLIVGGGLRGCLTALALAEHPTYVPGHQIVAASCALLDRETEGRRALARALELDSGLSMATLRGRIGAYSDTTFARYAQAPRLVGLPESVSEPRPAAAP